MNPPIAETLNLDQRKLPAEVFERFTHRQFTRRARAERAEKAWESFGKPGRDPSRLGSVADVLAIQGNWGPHLKLAQLEYHWDEVVGPGIAAHSRPAGYADGVLTIRTESTVWATQLTYLIPQLRSRIAERLVGLPVERVQVTGPRASTFGGGRYARRKY
ncbi:hypothetical protein G1C96_1587 [Bifidobacterium sp. DSM 109958]|uniref:DUF721 domain-containing protein n=1 Tax=Bifidobacterium moraviense TaxID=2675323 RepID=A0A7Y0F2U0_9BIFI|nr:DUF721 domain-containing protein [Bifidobacterium sp. DSM 109958]NMN01005.1 hypothetical protein [Bifidobacterium sp. DSM 109958]